MKYRAKITCIPSTVESLYNLQSMTVCHDSKDTWLEVDTEEEAERLDALNSLEVMRRKTYIELLQFIKR